MPEVNYNFDTTKWTNFKKNIKNSSHENREVSFCADTTTCSNSRTYGQDYWRYYQCAEHINNHIQGCFHTWDWGHYTAHCMDSHTLYNKYFDKYDHFNRPESHSRTTRHSKSVSFSTNLPEMPVLLGSEDGKIPRLAKAVTLAMFAYDKDCNLSGKETQEKEVYYDLYIQRIQDKNGAILKNQPLVKVLSNVKENSVGEGITFTFDSTKYEDGYYRFIGLARNMHDTYFLQDKPSNSITASGNYNGTDLYSGLSFPAGTRANSSSLNKKLYEGSKVHNMVTINKVLIKQNTNSFLSVKNAATSILNFIFANDDTSETEEGRYNASANIKHVYGQNAIADGDSYIALRGWTSGVTANIEVEERDVSQYIKVTGTLYRKSDGSVIPGSTVTAQFPINKSSPTSYTEIKAAGGINNKMEAYLYWPATLFSANNLKNGLEEVEIRLTTYEYDNAAGTSLADSPRTTSSIQTNLDGTESSTKNVFKVDKFSPKVTHNAVQDTWLAVASVTINIDDRFLNNAVNSSGTSSNLDKVSVKVVNRATNKTLTTYNWTVANGQIPKNAKNLSKTITIDADSHYDNIGIEITAYDKAGNCGTKTINNIKIDNTTAAVAISPAPISAWINQAIQPVLTFSKPVGAPVTKIQIAETTSPTPPANNSSSWKVLTSGVSREFAYNTVSAGKTTNSHYVHIIVEDGIHPAIRKTFGPYKVDLTAPNLALTSSADMWMYKPIITATVLDPTSGAPLKNIKYVWYKEDGSEGGAHEIDLSASVTHQHNSSYMIDIAEDTYENNIICVVTVEDMAGNVTSSTVTNLKADKTTPLISINPEPNANWINSKIPVVTNIEKPTGAPCAKIRIAETDSPVRPANNDSAWKLMPITNGGAVYHNPITGQSSGEHYVHVWVEKGTFDPNVPDSQNIYRSFSPYKVDLILPEMIDFQPSQEYPQKYGWYWEKPRFDIKVLDNGGSQMKDVRYIITPEASPPIVDDSWTSISPTTAQFSVLFPEGSHYVHVYMQDNAGNEQMRTSPIPTQVDTTAPVVNLTKNIIGELNEAGQTIGYITMHLSAQDDISGIRSAKYAITDNPTPPDLTVSGTNTPANLGRTNGWVDISNYNGEDISLDIDIKAPGKSYVHIFVENNAGMTIGNENNIYTFEENIDIIPTYLTSLVVDESIQNQKFIADKDVVQQGAGKKHIYAFKNVSNITNFDLHYVNYATNTKQTLQIDVIDCMSQEIVRSTRTSVSLGVGEAGIDSDVLPYNFPVWWVNGKTGQKLAAGIYEIKVSILDNEAVVNAISSYAIIKPNILTQPIINVMSDIGKADIATIFEQDTFYDSLLEDINDSFIKTFVQNLKNNHATTYSVATIDKNGVEESQPLAPAFDAGQYTHTFTTSKFVTAVATVEDAFGNVARVLKVVNFINNNPENLEPAEIQKRKEENQKNAEEFMQNTTSSIKHIETPSSDNYIIGGKNVANDQVSKNPFSFLAAKDTDEDTNE